MGYTKRDGIHKLDYCGQEWCWAVKYELGNSTIEKLIPPWRDISGLGGTMKVEEVRIITWEE